MNDKDFNIEFLLGVLNSKLLNWYFKSMSTNSNVNGYEVDALPIIQASIEKQRRISDIASSFLNCQSYGEESTSGAVIDQLVYDLYGLTEEEIAIIEESVGR